MASEDTFDKMKVIHKFTLTVNETEILIAPHSSLLSVQVQDNRICLWFLTEPAVAKTDQRLFVAVQTGEDFKMTNNHKYIGTVLLNHERYVLHIFEIIK